MASLLTCPVSGILLSCVLLLVPCAASAEKFPAGDGPVGFGPQSTTDKPEWQEQSPRLPDWPQADRLIELDVNTGGAPFRILVDPASISVGKDSVVRFTSVLVSSSGVWNVTYEGLHCGERLYRRLAYGSRERWHELPASGWLPLVNDGIGRYRYVLYNYFMCNPYAAQKDPGQIIQALHYPPRRILD